MQHARMRLGVYLTTRLAVWGLWALLVSASSLMVTILAVLDLMFLAASSLWTTRPEVFSPLLLWSRRIVLLGVGVASVSLVFDRLAAARIAPPPVAAPVLPLPVDGGVAVFAGTIDLGSYRALQATLAQYPGLQTLRLTGPGGHIPSARGMARLVSEAGLNTEAAGLCASACTLVFVAGVRRKLLPGGALGFHAYRLQTGANLLDPKAEEARDRSFMQGKGVSAAFLDRVFATDHNDQWQPDPATLRENGVLTD